MSEPESSAAASTAPAPATAPRVRPGMKAAVGTAVAAATLAAVTALSGPVYSSDPASILSSPANSASSRIAGVHADMARAVALQQVTPEQAAFLEQQLVRRIQADA
ncbi:hypothetical protein QO003_002018 [Arthrobacter silviterrae]|uniref:M23 family peptidase n=1 Tax=Arthrobacter silviterrae TaxID=2026658 RepID=A0ABX0DL70_9MICC|nr:MULTISPECIES: hypothetical protein [Arthrobacter]MCU6482225.1 hypothetical protein [Arthrobacter sp. A2-55]MDQ0277715.1 hypothetical protein [Arthrobacter silviterrae]NGN85430.1 hypothetical protein [Arthrobacter silviterrae]